MAGGSFRDKFPREWLSGLAEKHFKPGVVLRFHVKDTYPPKIKRLVVIAIDRKSDGFLAVYFNSSVNPHVLRTDHQRQLQIFFEKTEDRPYLARGSYLDCSNVHEFPLSKIKGSLTGNPGKWIGALSGEELEQAIGKLRGAKTVSPKIKKRYGLL
ncbi:MAG: hypothetical protein ACNS63_04430 [Candidatus Nitrospinota bacterium M3_3B_026]